MAGSVSALCGRLVVCGLSGHAITEEERKTLAGGKRAGVVLFKRNIAPGLGNVTGLAREILAAGGPSMLIAVDQEGGRVMRLGPPSLQLPPMRKLGAHDLDTITKVAEVQGRELARYGFNMSFAPVVDIHTRKKTRSSGIAPSASLRPRSRTERAHSPTVCAAPTSCPVRSTSPVTATRRRIRISPCRA